MIEVAPPAEVLLTSYTARQSLISAFSAPTAPPSGIENLESDFQQRMVLDDFRGSLARELDDLTGQSDALLLDFVDERLGVYRTDTDSYVTRSLELIRSGIDSELAKNAEHVAFGTGVHFRLWKVAFRSLVDAVASQPNSTQVVVLNVPWARPEGLRSDLEPSRLNRQYARYYRFALACAPQVRLSKAEVQDDPLHRWGPAPFHYTRDTYSLIYSRLRERLGIQ